MNSIARCVGFKSAARRSKGNFQKNVSVEGGGVYVIPHPIQISFLNQ